VVELKCPWCKRFLELYLRDDGTLPKDVFEREKERLSKGFWRAIKDVHFPLRIGETLLGEGFNDFKFDSLARIRDKVVGRELEHYWVVCMNWINPICCEMAYFAGAREQLDWEIYEVEDLRNLSEKIRVDLEKIDY